MRTTPLPVPDRRRYGAAMTTKIHALIVAGGKGLRLGADQPKQYALAGGLPLLRHAVMAFRRHPRIAYCQIVHGADQQAECAAALAGLDGLQPVVPGGTERQDSVRNGLEALGLHAHCDDIVLVHDAARPFPPAALIDRAIAAIEAGQLAAIPVLPVIDSLKKLGPDGVVIDSVQRDGLGRVQTPQAFRFGPLLAAHRLLAGQALGDDAGVMELAGHRVATFEGAEDAFKVTSQADLARARAFADPGPDIRSGTGFDVHRLGPGDGVHLCGIFIPWTRTLIGHSDADVGWHALTDAILGAIAAGDIGSHFPPSDAHWRGADSAIFLAEAARLVSERGGRILSCDVTVICERPKVGPRRDAMRARTAEVLGIAPDRVSVKATTTEELGFTGRGEGIAAQAIATVLL